MYDKTHYNEKKRGMLSITNYQEMQIETKMSYHLTPIRIAIIKR